MDMNIDYFLSTEKALLSPLPLLDPLLMQERLQSILDKLGMYVFQYYNGCIPL